MNFDDFEKPSYFDNLKVTRISNWKVEFSINVKFQTAPNILFEFVFYMLGFAELNVRLKNVDELFSFQNEIFQIMK